MLHSHVHPGFGVSSSILPVNLRMSWLSQSHLFTPVEKWELGAMDHQPTQKILIIYYLHAQVILQNSQKNTRTSLFFNKKFFIKKETLAQVFFCEFREIFQNTVFYKTTLLAASEPIEVGLLKQSFADVLDNTCS